MNQELCGPCKDKGLVVIAHYQGIPAGKSPTGKEVPPQCYYHHFNMPLPKSFENSTSLINGNGPEEPEKAKEEVTPITEQPQQERICSRPGCGRKLLETNTTGRCFKHFYIPKKEQTAEQQALKKAVRQKRTPYMVNRPAESATVQISELTLDAWWRLLTIKEKGDLFVHHVAGELLP